MKYEILIIEDEEKTAEYLSLALEKENFNVEIADTGKKGLDKLKEKKFDLIVLDLKMPEMSGDEVLKEFRKIDPFTEVLVYTNHNNSEEMQKLINLGIDGFMKKGGKADLWNIVEIIKTKLEPIEEDLRKKMLDKFFNNFNPNS